MYNLKEKTLNNQPIEKFEVWFMIPLYGLVKTLDDAIKLCDEQELDHQLCINPIPVAIRGETYEVLLR